MLLAIVPAYNEEERIGSVVRDLFEHVDEVVVVDDASSDATVAAARAAGATVLEHRINRGQGAALETGHAYARGKGATHVLHFDGDGQFDVADIAPAQERMDREGVDIIFGSRFLDNRSNVPFLKRVLILPAGRLLDRMTGSVSLSDSHNGFRLLNGRALEHIRITQDRMAHASEIPQLAKAHNLRYSEHPVRVQYHEFGQGALGGVRILRDLITGKFVR